MKILVACVFPAIRRHLPVLFLVLLLESPESVAQRVTLIGRDMPLPVIMNQIKEQTHLTPTYIAGTFDGAPHLPLNLKDVPLDKALHIIFAGLRYQFTIRLADSIITINREHGASLYRDLEGKVTTADRKPLAHVTVTVPLTKITVMTDSQGRFRLPVTGFGTRVVISCVEFDSVSREFSNKYFWEIRLTPVSAGLNAVVVVAYGSTTQRLTTSSVTKVKSDVIEEEPVANLLAALEGRVSRLTIRQLNGVPGSAYETFLGGRHSIQQGTDPLFVLDGVPLPGDGFLPPFGSGSAQGEKGASTLNGIPLGDIASIEVLKDASATAIYGSRGSNGVILITTKEGMVGQPRWTAEVSQGASRVVHTSPLLSTLEFLALRREAIINDGASISKTNLPEANAWDTTRNQDYKRQVSGGTGSYRDIRLGFNGGDSLTRVLLSGSAHNESGVFPGTTTDQRLSLYGNLHHRSRDLRLKLNFSALYTREDTHLPWEDYSPYAYLAPDVPPFTNASGQPQWGPLNLPYENIPALRNNTYVESMDYLFGRLQVNYALNRGFSLEASLGGNNIETREQSLLTIAGQYPLRVPPPTGRNYTADNGYKSGIAEFLGRYLHNAGPGRLEALAGVTYQGEESAYSSLLLDGVTSDVLLASGSGATTTTPASNRVYYRYDALFARANYNIQNKYLLSASDRWDGSSRFGPGDQFGNFWGVGGAWIFSEENFARGWRSLSFGKLRGSYGTTGNDQIGDNQFAQLYTATSSARGYQGQQGVVLASLANNQLHWERNSREEAALDLGFLDNRLLFSAGVYRSQTRNQLVYTQLPVQAGFPGVLVNQPANVVNEGLEFLLQTNLPIGVLHWTSSLTLTIPRNYLKSWSGLGNSSLSGTLTVGQSLSSTRGLHFTGVSTDSGLYTFQGVNHNSQPGPGDFVPSPSLDPKWYGGWSHSLQYGNWGLDVFFEYRRGNGVNPLTVLDKRNPPGMRQTYELSNGPKEWLNRWQHPGDISSRQRLTDSVGSPAWTTLQEYLESDATVCDASFLRLKTVALHYQFPRDWLRAHHLRELRIYLRGQNLWTKTRFPVTDPETQSPIVLPPMRTLVAGFMVSF